jgi:hypothetical protein
MSAMNDLLRTQLLALLRIGIGEDHIVLPNTAINTQAGAYPVRSACVRVTSAPLNASMILDAGDAGTAQSWTFVINDSSNAVKVFGAAGEKHGGVTNGSTSVPAGQTGLFIRTTRDSAVGQDWRSSLIS